MPDPAPRDAPAPFLPSATDGNALRLSTSRLRALIDHLQSGLLVEDEHRNIVHVNQAFLKMFGIPLSPEQMVGMNCSQAAEQSKAFFTDPEGFVARIADILARRELAKGDELRLVDGRFLERDYVPIYLDGEFRGHYWHYRDITERMRAQQEIRDLNRQLEERVRQLAAANAELERITQQRAQLVSAVAHELGNAVAPLKTQLFLLDRRAGGGSPAEPGVVMMRRNLDRLSLLVEDLLDASRLHAGALSVRPAPVELRGIVEEAVEAFAEQAREKGVHLELGISPEVRLQADGRRVIQVMYNLLSNALKFTPAGGRVVVSLGVEGEMARITVADTGCGLTPESIAKLFQPFSQAHDASRGAKGTGLGLFICRGILELHGGRIWCESDGPGRGASFHIALPVRPRAASAPPPAAAVPRAE